MILLVAVGCGGSDGSNSSPTAPSTSAPREATLHVGEETTFGGVRIKVVSVENDSRCPADVQCVWAGNAEINLDVTSSAEPTRVKLNWNPSLPHEITVRGVRIRVAGLDPVPYQGKGIAQSEYVIKLALSQN